MEIAIGAILALAACGLGVVAGFERDRAFYPVMLIVIASYYDLFAVIGGDEGVLGIEVAISLAFVAVSWIRTMFPENLSIAGARIENGRVVMDKPAHASFELRADFPSMQVGVSRVGVDTLLGTGHKEQ